MSGSQLRRFAFVSVSDKTGLVPLARRLAESHELLCSDGTHAHLQREGVPNLHRLSDVTGWPEMLGETVLAAARCPAHPPVQADA